MQVRKRTLDIMVSAAALSVLLPVFLVIAAIIKVTSEGPVFYRGRRAGLHGRPFHMLKFRSMVPDAERLGGSATADDDPRLTMIGRMLRKYKLDELPQFVNVLLGDMSLVGPRPEVEKYTSLFTPEKRRILSVRPGITDWASIWNSDEGSVLNGSTDPERAYEQLIRPTKLKLQVYYVDNLSIRTDLKILSYTLMRLCRRSWIPSELAAYGLPKTARIQEQSQFTAS